MAHRGAEASPPSRHWSAASARGREAPRHGPGRRVRLHLNQTASPVPGLPKARFETPALAARCAAAAASPSPKPREPSASWGKGGFAESGERGARGAVNAAHRGALPPNRPGEKALVASEAISEPSPPLFLFECVEVSLGLVQLEVYKARIGQQTPPLSLEGHTEWATRCGPTEIVIYSFLFIETMLTVQGEPFPGTSEL